MYDRRQFLGALAAPALVPLAAPSPRRAIEVLARAAAAASEEEYWAEIGLAFTVDRSLVNLNNGGVSPSPAFVQQAMKRHLDYSNEAPPYTMWQILEPQREAVRERLARFWAVDPEEIALTRNASEGLQICQLGMELRAGDEVLTTTQDYPRMITTFRQRERRDGIVLKQFSIPVPAEDPAEVVRRFESNITPRTRVILVSHVVFLTGQILPVPEIVAMARRHGVPAIVDGAHALAHFDFTLAALDCDYYATSLHKWLCAPHGTGLLYVRREKIPGLWPLMAAEAAKDGDIRKFEEIGTHPAAPYLAIAEALTFHQGIGAKRKADRLVHLREYWIERLAGSDRVHLHTSRRPGLAGGIATVQVDGLESGALAAWLWSAHRILVTAIKHEEFEGIRVSPSVYTTHEELDRLVDAVEQAMREGLPG
ncbi:MAG: aminotransferase class V-fold PLP-dependent enzyme [Planctomycetota bacterium]